VSAAVQPAPVPFAPTESQLAVAYSVCRHITRRAAKNFYYAFLVLPRAKRHALSAIYAYMRKCDDIADDATMPIFERRQKLGSWLDSVHRALSGQPTDDAILLALTDTHHRYNIPVQLLDQLAYGTEMDVDTEADDLLVCETPESSTLVRYRTFEDLQKYCYHVASVVGLVCIRIFGYDDPAAEPLAEKCGLAFQLTNIIRDVKEDADMGRVYLPEEDLAKFGIAPMELRNAPDMVKVRPLLEMEAGRALDYYKAGDALVDFIEEDSQPALWVLVNIYRKLLEKIALRNYDVFSGKVSLTVREKLGVLAKGFLKRLT